VEQQKMADLVEVDDPLAEYTKDGRYLKLSQRPGWADVTPIPQDEGANPPCPINYTPEFRETMDYFRAMLKADEKSLRSLRLTKEVISINAASYTAWHFRRLVLVAVGGDLAADRAWLDKMASENPKNYQLWYHRRWVVDLLQDPSAELAFTAAVLEQDSKNYHAWAHRQWVLSSYGLWAGELDWIDAMLQQDRRNNSAWNQRYFVVSHCDDLTLRDVRQREIDYAWSWIRKSPNNQSPWSYLSAMIKDRDIDADFPELRAQLEEAALKWVTCPHVLSLLIDLAEQRPSPARLLSALDHATALATRLAPVHEKYWHYRAAHLQQLLNQHPAQ
jgi:protein farnesyltransferase/geranylgeranyltransferase type-1 subunit alpha